MSKSFALPFQVVGGRIATTTDPTRIIEQKIVDVLVTGNLERPTNPSYGAGAQRLVFEQIDELVEADFKIDAGLELAKRINGIQVVDLVFKQDEFSSTAEVRVLYRTALSSLRTLTFQISSDTLTEETPI
jgi:hypothetical protein